MPVTHAVIHNGTAPATMIKECLRDATAANDVIGLPWYGRPTDGLAAVYDFVLDNQVSFVMYHTEDNVPAKAFRTAEHGSVQEVTSVSKALINAVTVPGGKIFVLWNDDDAAATAATAAEVQFIFDHADPKTLVFELTNGLAPISLSLAPDAAEVSPEKEVDADPESDPTDSVSDDENFSKAELEIMTVPVLKRLAEKKGLPTGVTGKTNYIKVILGQELPEASFPPGPREEPKVDPIVKEAFEKVQPVTIADKDLTQPKPEGWKVPTGDEAHAQLRKSLMNQTPSPQQVETIEDYRQVALRLGEFIIDNIPLGRNRSLALTALEDVVMRGVKGILLD
jgi:hypothetical protein